MTITLNADYDVTLSTALLGYVGETNARPVSVEGMEIDGADRYVLTIDYGDGVTYEVDITGGQWTPTADILRSAQTVSCQICAKKLSGQEYILLKKSRIFRLRIGAAIGDTAIPSPSVAVDALDKIDAIGRQAHADMQTAVTAAETATTMANNAAKSATNAEKSADTATQAASRAETAKTAAETSATQAETAMQGAETARTEAVTAQNAAKVSAAQASVSAQQTEADKTATAGYAKTAKTNADSTAADRQAVQEMATQVTADKANVAENTAKVAEDRTAAETAAQTAQSIADSLPEDYTTAVEKIAENTAEINNTNSNVSQLKEDLDDNRETLIQINKSLSEFEVGEYTVESGYYDLISPTVKKDNSNYQCIKMAVEPNDILKITADVNASQTLAMAICYDADFNYKSYVEGRLSKKTKFTDYEFIIPNGIRFITVTSIYSAPIVKISSVKQNIATDVTKNTNDISFLKNGNITKKVNNIVTNGNFVGTSNWAAIYSTVSASNNILSITGNGNNARAIAQISQTIQFDESMRIFACAKIRVTNDACESLTITTASGIYMTRIVKPVKDKWYTIACIQDSPLTKNYNLMYFDHAYSDATTANGKVMEVKEVIAFDAMKVFSEYPPLYKCMNIIDYNEWWSGEKEVIIEKIHKEEKINNADNGYLLPMRTAYQSSKRPIVTFVNDDGWQDDYNKLVAISEKHQVPFVSALFNGSTMREWYELYLQNELGWEFASHPRNTALAELETEEDIEQAMIETNEYLTNRGLIYHNLVYPYGSNDERVRRIAKKYYRCACTTDSNGLNKDVISSFTLYRYPLGYGGTDETNTLANLKAKVDEAVANNSWLIFMLHPQMAAHTDAITQMIDDLITYIKSIGVDILTLNDGYNIFGNALECGDFTGGDTGFAIGFDGTRKNI